MAKSVVDGAKLYALSSGKTDYEVAQEALLEFTSRHAREIENFITPLMDKIGTSGAGGDLSDHNALDLAEKGLRIARSRRGS